MEADALKGKVCVSLEGKGELRFDHDFSLFSRPSRVYSHSLARLACAMVAAGYDRIVRDTEPSSGTCCPYTQKGLKKVLDAMGFSKSLICPTAERDEVSFYLAFRELTLDGRRFDLFVAAPIGSYKKTWFSNFDPLGRERVCNEGRGYAGDGETGAIHLGFADAREYVWARARDFILRHRTGSPIKLFVIGHSRGGATAALLAAKLISQGGFGEEIPIDPDDIFTYCFAVPNYADTRFVDVSDERFSRIFNINSPEDLVTALFPKECGFGRYGTTYSFFGPDDLSVKDYAKEKAAMTRFFSGYRPSRPYAPYRNGRASVDSVVAAMASGMADMDAFYGKRLRLCFSKATPYEYFRDTLCSFVGGTDGPEDERRRDRAQKLMIASAFDPIGTCRAFRRISAFFVFNQGLAAATGGKIGKEYFNDSHIIETYLAYMMSMTEEQLMKEQHVTREREESAI